MRNLIKMIFLTTFFLSLSIAQTSSSDKDYMAGDEKKIDQLFDQIMMSFPGEIKAKIDSASGASVQSDVQTGNAESPESRTFQRRDALINELPQEVRMQVEKAISEMEKRRSERALQFKEYRSNQIQK